MNEELMEEYILCIDRHCTSEKRIYTTARDGFAHGGHHTESLGSIFRRTRIRQGMGMTRQELIRRVEDEREKCVSRYRAQVEEISQGLIREIPQQVDDNMHQLIRILHEPRGNGLPDFDLLNTMSQYFHTLENDIDVQDSNAQANSFATRVPRTFSQLLQLQTQSVKAKKRFSCKWIAFALILIGIGAALHRTLCSTIKCDLCSSCEVPPLVCPQYECPTPVSNETQQCEPVEPIPPPVCPQYECPTPVINDTQKIETDEPTPPPPVCPQYECPTPVSNDTQQCETVEPIPPPVCPQYECPTPVINDTQKCEKVKASDDTPIHQSVSRFYGKLRQKLADTNVTENERIYILENLAKHAHDKLQFEQSFYDYQTLIAMNPKDEVEYYQAIADLHRESDQTLKEYEVRQKVKYLVERQYGPNSILTAEQIAKMANLERELGLFKRYHSNIQQVLQTLQLFKPRDFMNLFWRNWINSIQFPDEQLPYLQRKLAMFEDAYTPSDRNCLSVEIEIAQLLRGHSKIQKLVDILPKINDIFTEADIYKQMGDTSRQLHNADKTQPDQRGNYYQKAYNLEKSQFDGSEHSIYLDSVDGNTPRLEMLQSIKDCIKYCPGMNQQRLADRGLQIINHYYPTTKFPASQAIVDEFMRLNLK